MALASGTKLGPYEIQSPLGAGGMGEVYRARDARLERTVAIKILPAHLSKDPEARQRFEREARSISSVSHANICHLYDIGSQDGMDYLVMEFLEGETLADRLVKGPLTLPQVLRFGGEICDGLERAHRTGVVHRDLKPGNIMLTRSGAKIMDFGLAKVTPVAKPASSDLSVGSGETAISQPITAQGTVIGTFQYMSPEQVEGKELDARSDIFSFGAVLYEMVTGKRAFDGKNQISVASAILEKEPDPITSTQPLAPPSLDHVVRGCLAKDPESRWQSAADIARELRWITASGSSAGPALPVHLRRRVRERLVWAAAAGVLLVLAVWSLLREPAGTQHVVRAYLPAPQDAPFYFTGDFSGPPVLSPDGSQVLFCALSKNVSAVWVQALDHPAATRLEGTEGAAHPFWSPDGKFIAFSSDGKLKKMPSGGGPITILADSPNPRGGSWSKDNVILYAPDYRDSLWKVSAAGGTAVRATTLDSSKHTTHRWPFFLPDGKHFLYYAANHTGRPQDQNGIYFASLDGGQTRFVLASDSMGQYASGYLLFHSQTTLMAQKFDPVAGVLSGEPAPVVDQAQYDNSTWRTTFTVSGQGTLLFLPGTKAQGLEYVWKDRAGNQVGTIGDRASFQGMRVSPDGRRLAVALGEPRPDIWIFDLLRGGRTRLTLDTASHFMPSWSADGQRVAYTSQSGGAGTFGSTIHVTPASGGGQDELLLKVDDPAVTLDWPEWSADGRYLVYQQSSGPSGTSVWALPTSGDKKPFPVVQPQSPQARVVHHRLSPDGHWLAYSATDTGKQEVYVTRFPSGRDRWQVSQNGGIFPVWRADSKEIYFIGTDSVVRLHVAAVGVRGNEFEVQSVRPLFPLPSVAAVGALFDVSPDGQRFVIPVPTEAGTGPMALVLNWTAEMKKK